MLRSYLAKILFGQSGHCSVLGAHIGTHFYGNTVRLAYRFPLKNGCAERAGKGIACSHGIGHFHFRRFLKRHAARSENVATVYTAGEHEHIEIVLAENEPAFIFHIEPRITEHTANAHEFFVVYLENVAEFERFLYDFFRIKRLPQVDVEDAKTILL